MGRALDVTAILASTVMWCLLAFRIKGSNASSALS